MNVRGTISILWFIAISIPSVALSAGDSCTSRLISPNNDLSSKPSYCAFFNDPEKGVYKKYADGTALPNVGLILEQDFGPLTGEVQSPLDELFKAQKASPAQLRRVGELAEAVRKMTIEEIKGDTRQEELTSIQKTVLKRLSDAKIKIGSDTGSCGTMLPQAEFDRTDIVICQSVTNFPLEALLPLLAHEFAHAADICTYENVRDAAKLKLSAHPFFRTYVCSQKYETKASVSDSKKRKYSQYADQTSIQGCSASRLKIEHFADVVGARVTARLLTEKPAFFKKENLKDMLFFLYKSVCYPPNPHFETVDYPEGSDRIHSFVQHPEIQRALDCSELKVKTACPLDGESGISRSSNRSGK